MTVEICLHGQVQLRPSGGADASAVPLAGQLVALVAIVALEPGVRRERVAELLWPESCRGRQNLRQLLLRLRALVERPLIEGEAQLQLAPGVRLAEAVDGAELLPGTDASAGTAFAAWLATQRERDRQQRLAPHRAALALAEAGGDWAHALAAAQALIALDALEEEHHRALMRLHYQQGESAAGLAAYERLRTRLREQFGTEPSAASQAMAASLRRGGSARPGGEGGALQTTARGAMLPMLLKRPPRLVGREAESAAVHAAWAAGEVVLLEGEAGLGKSRLIDELTAAPEGGAALGVARTAGRPGDRGVPYTTLARLLAQPRPPVAMAEPAQAALAVVLMPATASVAPATPASATPLQATALLAALGHWLQQHGLHTLVVDDLHFADEATLDLLTAMATAPPPAVGDAAAPSTPWPRRWLLAQRPAEGSSVARDLCTALAESGRLVRVPLAPLSAEATALLIEDLAVAGLDAQALAPALARHTGGNPLFLLESIKQGLASGSLQRGELVRPASVQSLIALRLERLSEGALMLARVAAVAGADFGIELAEAVTGRSAAELAAGWDELQRAQVLREEAFAHDLVAAVCAEAVPAVVARRLHAQCAQWLANRTGSEPARVAAHWEQGGHPREAAAAWKQAERRAELANRTLERGEHLLAAARCHAAAGDRERAFACRLLRLDAIANTEDPEGRSADAEALIAEAVGLAETVQATSALVAVLSQRGLYERAAQLGLQTLAQARRAGLEAQAWTLASPLQQALTQLGRADELEAVLLPLLSWTESHGTPRQRMTLLAVVGAWQWHVQRVREGNATRERALALATEHGFTHERSILLGNLAVGYQGQGLALRALATAEQALLATPEVTSGRVQHWIRRFTLARQLVDVGRYGRALAELEVVCPLLHDQGLAFWTEAADILLARLWIAIGQPARAVPLLKANARLPNPVLRGQWLARVLELGAMPGLPGRDAALAESEALLPATTSAGLTMAVLVLPAHEPAQILERAPALAQANARAQSFGMELAVRALLAQAWTLRPDTAPTSAAAGR
jgi:DNA-binding SARP family transcriptional activator